MSTRQKNIIKITLVVIFVITSSSFANINFGAFGTFNDASDVNETLIGVGGKLETYINPQLSIDLRVSYEMAEVKFKDYDPYYGHYSQTFDVAILPIVVSLNWNIPVNNQFIPYLGGGIGYYIPLKDIDDADAEFGGNIHGGIKFRISNGVELFGEAKYRFLEFESTDFGGFGVIAGISFGNQMM